MAKLLRQEVFVALADDWQDVRTIRQRLFGPDVPRETGRRTNLLYSHLQKLKEAGAVEQTTKERDGFYVSYYRRGPRFAEE